MKPIDLTPSEIAGVLRRRQSKARRKLSGPKLSVARTKPKHGQEKDPAYLAWLHHGLPCIGCLTLGGAPQDQAYIEAAHQKIQAADLGLNRKMGVKPGDRWTLPLCAHHHRLGPLCCDPAQGKFWRAVGLAPAEVADLCAGLYAAFQAGDRGRPIILRFASMAAAMRCGRAS